MIEEFNLEHNGAIYEHFRSSSEAAGVCSFGDERYIYKGKPTFTILTNSYKFNKEIQLGICVPKSAVIKKEKRNNSPWQVIEINMNYEAAKELLTAVSAFLALNDTHDKL